MNRVLPNEVEHIGIVGAGTIGASWAAYFLACGYRITAYDPAPNYEAYVRDYIENAWPSLTKLGIVNAKSDPDAITCLNDLPKAVKEVQFIQESVPERLPIKHEVYAQIESVISPDIVIASSASGLMVSELQQGTRHPGRFVLAHPFNPPHLIPLVEIVGGKETDSATVDWALDFFNGCGKQAIRINSERPGHVANRLQAAVWREAIYLVAEGVASVEDVDRAMAFGPGLRWAIFGPHMTFHLGSGGHGMGVFIDRYKDSFHRWWEDLGEPTITDDVAKAIADGVSDEEAGRSFEELAGERDAKLVAMLSAFNKF